MRDLTLNEVQEVNGGNPIIAAMIAVRLGQLAAPYAVAAARAAAAYIGAELGEEYA